jgi:hypothetical protein
VALNLYVVRKDKGPSGEFYRRVAKQRPGQYQGVYIVTPEGKLIDGGKKETAGELLGATAAALKAFGPVTVRRVHPADVLAHRGVGRRPDGSIVLAVYARAMLLGLDPRGFGTPTIDSIVLTGVDRDRLEFPGLKVGDDFKVGTAVVRKFHRLLSPSSDENTMPRAAEVTAAALTGKVVRVAGGVAYLSFSGRVAGYHTWEFDANKGKKIHAAVRLGGVGSCDAKSGKLLSLTLLADGVYRSWPPNDEAKPYAAVAEWRLQK